jgi:predicted amidohydrolase YtcJ
MILHLLALIWLFQSPAPPDAVFHNGKVVTVDGEFSVRQAFAVQGDKFVVVGTNPEILALAGPKTRVVNLEGRTVIPGLMDNHNHQYRAASTTMRGLSITGVASLADRISPLKSRRWVVEHAAMIHPDQMDRYFYVTRKTMDGSPLGLPQKISSEEALRLATVNNAYLTFEEDVKGSIESGKLADFLILSGDLMTVPEEQIPALRPVATYVGGKKVFSNSEGTSY